MLQFFYAYVQRCVSPRPNYNTYLYMLVFGMMMLFLIKFIVFPRIPVSGLVDSWPSLLALLKDSLPLGLPAPGQFLILGSVSHLSLMSTHRVVSSAQR